MDFIYFPFNNFDNNLYGSAGGRKFNRIGDLVNEDLFQTNRVG